MSHFKKIMNPYHGYWNYSFASNQLYLSTGTSQIIGFSKSDTMISVKDLMKALSKKQIKLILDLLLLAKDDHKEYNLEIYVTNKEKQKKLCWLTMYCIEDIQTGLLFAYGGISSDCFCEKRSNSVGRQNPDLLNRNFLRTITHEIMTPINIILGSSQLILKEKKLEDEVKLFTRYIQDSANSLYEMFLSMLDLSKLYSHKLELKKNKFHVAEIFEAIDGKYKRILDKKYPDRSFCVEMNQNVEKLILDTDQERLIQVIDILLDNAIKFSSSGEITVGSEIVLKKMIRFYVCNKGVPIPNETLSYLFNPFTRYDESLSRSTGGLGIGLSLASELVHLMSGMIGLKQDGETVEFYVDIPSY